MNHSKKISIYLDGLATYLDNLAASIFLPIGNRLMDFYLGLKPLSNLENLTAFILALNLFVLSFYINTI